MMSRLKEFLLRNSVVPARPPGLVHTCQAYSLDEIMKDDAIKPSMCDVFGEPLAYFFVGRPAYKRDLDPDAAEWELPVCFVFEYDISSAKRIYPLTLARLRKPGIHNSSR